MIACPTSVKIATEADADALYTFCISAHEEMRHAPVNTEKVWNTVTNAITKRVNPVFGIIKEGNIVVAAIGLHIQNWWYSDDYAVMSFFGGHLHSDHRKSSHAADLVKFSDWFGAQLGLRVYLMDWTDGDGGKSRLFAKNGARAGSMFLVRAA
jgi:hypothetical protein